MSKRAKPEPRLAVTPSELRTILEFVGLRDYRADNAVRLAAYLATMQGAPTEASNR